MAKRTPNYQIEMEENGQEVASYDEEFETRIKVTIDKLGKDYDLDNLNSNDLMALRALAQALISLEDYEIKAYSLKKNAKLSYEYDTLQRIEQTLSSLRTDVVRLQDSLGITRIKRTSDKTLSIQEEIENQKRKAKEVYRQRMAIILCPKCGMWLASAWFKNTENPNNKVYVVCDRKLDSGSICGEKITVTIKDLMKHRGTNAPDLLPESLR